MHIALEARHLAMTLKLLTSAYPSPQGALRTGARPSSRGVSLQAQDGALTATLESDALQVSQTLVEVPASVQGRCTVDCLALLTLMEEAGDSIVVLRQEGKRSLVVSWGKRSARIACVDPLDSPSLYSAPEAGTSYSVSHTERSTESRSRRKRDSETYCETYDVLEAWRQVLSLDAGQFAELVSSVTYAVLKAPWAPVLGTVKVQLRNDTFTLSAFGSYRFAYRSVYLPGTGTWPHDVLIRAAELERALAVLTQGHTPQVTLEVAQSIQRRTHVEDSVVNDQASMVTTGICLKSGRICAVISPQQGTLPDFTPLERPLERDRWVHVNCPTEELRQAVSELLPLVGEGLLYLHLSAEESSVKLEAPAHDGHRAALCRLPGARADGTAAADFHGESLAQLLRAIDRPELEIALLAERSKRAAFFRSRGGGGASTHALQPFDPDAWSEWIRILAEDEDTGE
jgi:DNA polymerase III sliding clamp (beta) subunit (PCNA family)